jgi:thiamine pyrophosphate-dependent acetolactate synthase large subunit-like protein
LKLDSWRWPAVFQALGCRTERVESQPALDKALREWASSSGPMILEVCFDADAYLHMTESIR